ncbi:MAG: sugar ABC transporter permease [Chloroflexota bacterium]|jgi:multiple sugar transport system permease protein|nr:sugar ABC transporter permease [Chloroflexota bacterium]
MAQQVADTTTTTPTPRPTRRRFSEETIAGYITISPWIIGFLVFTAIPFFASLYFSFTRYDVINPPEWVGLDNYTRLLTEDRYFPQAVQNTFIYALMSIPANIITSLGAAMLLHKAQYAKGFFRTAFYLPAMTPAIATAYIWLWILNPNDGVVNQFLRFLHLPAPGWTVDPLWTKPAIVITQVWVMGGAMIMFLAALQGVPRDLYESAELDGAGRWERFRSVTLPMISGVTFFVATISTVAALSVFTEGYVMFNEPLGGPGQSALFIIMYLYQRAFTSGSLQMGYASSIAWVLFLMIMVVTIIQFRLSKRWVYYEHSND